MTTLYLARHDVRGHRWFPVGRLIRHETDPAEYEFAYVAGVKHVNQMSPLWHVPGFPELNLLYRSSEVFPVFGSRVMDLRRPDRKEYLSYLGIDVDSWDEVTELALSGGGGPWDRFEMFPEIVPDVEGRFDTRFVLHGLQHNNPDSIRRSESLKVGEVLNLALEVNSSGAINSISLGTPDHYPLGWLPRYLVTWLLQNNSWKVTEADAKVAKVNRAAPLSHRLLVEFGGRVPRGFRWMRDLPEYKPIYKSPPQIYDLQPRRKLFL